MSKWVTYYSDLLHGVYGIKIHKNREEATNYFKNHYRDAFQINTNLRKIILPASYGYAHRRFVGTSIGKFKKIYPDIDLSKVEDGE
ncbi:MAG: hypothetical protein K6A05_04905 [Lachnospiraceae bacterium]|nr:hypothetical protein [Lachnospiraceae bacterium]